MFVGIRSPSLEIVSEDQETSSREPTPHQLNSPSRMIRSCRRQGRALLTRHDGTSAMLPGPSPRPRMKRRVSVRG